MKKHEHIIKNVIKNSIAEQLELEAGDVLLSINEKEVIDIFDFRYLCEDENLVLEVRKTNGETWELEIEKEYYEELGIEFEDGLMDTYRSCKNKCIFCFIDQLPKGMRDTLYFKDDDARLSFLQGNYITLTNLSEQDVERIIFYKLSPINISVHTTNPELRCKMLNNRFAGDALKLLDRFYEAGIEMNGQIVLCKNYNDGKELDRTIEELTRYLPYMQSVSVVPIGMTKFREGLTSVEPFTKEDAVALVKQVETWQMRILKKHGIRMIHASDEWYIKAELPIPDSASYEGYPQIENGVGMVRSLGDEVAEVLLHSVGDDRKRICTIATGTLAAPVLSVLTEEIEKKYRNVHVNVVPIINHFFGENITVAGLLTGQDICAQLKEHEIGEELLLSDNLLKSGTDLLLDDLRIADIENALQTKVRIVKSDGEAFVRAVLGEKEENDRER